MHFCAVVARAYGRLSKPRNTSLNWFIPAFVNKSVGSSPGTTGLDATIVWPLLSKNFRNVERISEAFIGCLWSRCAPGQAARAEGGDFTRRPCERGAAGLCGASVLLSSARPRYSSFAAPAAPL